MADDERTKKIYPSRRNPPQNRPTPGVQKAIQTFGVRDLREILDKKRQEQGESQGHGVYDKRPEPKQVNLPPPDPSYNYLKDPTRDTKPRPLQKKSDHDKQFERPVARDRETNPHHPRYIRDERYNRNRDFVPQERILHSRDTRHQENKEKYQGHKERYQDDRENTSMQEKGALKQNLNSSEVAPKKELRFSDTPTVKEQPKYQRGGRGGSRSRNMRREGGIPREVKDEKIENPFNIKIELSTATGLRNCTLDENTKIPDIKHVPDQLPHQKYSRGGFRGGKGTFRGRGRGRGNFRGRASYRGREPRMENVSNESSFNMEELKKSLQDSAENKNMEPNGNVQFEASNYEKNNEKITNENEEAQESCEDIFERYDDYDQDDEYNDANENYDDEFPNEYYSDYQNESTEQAQNLDNSHTDESSPESERYDQGTSDIIDQDLKGTITITSSKFQDGEVQRSIEVIPKVDGKRNEGDCEEDVEKKGGKHIIDSI